MNTRSTKRSTSAPKSKRRSVAAPKTVTTTRVTRRQQQKAAESQPQVVEEVEPDVFETTAEEVVEHHVSAEDDGIQQAVEEVVDNTDAGQQELIPEDSHQSQQEVIEAVEEIAEQEVEEHDIQTQVHHIVVNESSAGELSANELSADLSNYWTEEKNPIDGKLEFVCKWILCSFRTQSECSIRKHAVKHQKPYQCSFIGCGQRFVETQDLLEHFSATHMDTNAFKCTFADCDQRFRDIKALTEHRVSHVSHTTQLIKANKDYKPVHSQRLPSQPTTQAIDLQQIFGQSFDNTVNPIISFIFSLILCSKRRPQSN